MQYKFPIFIIVVEKLKKQHENFNKLLQEGLEIRIILTLSLKKDNFCAFNTQGALMFFTPTLSVIGIAAASSGVGFIISPFNTLVYGSFGAIQGGIGAMALNTFGFGVGSIYLAAGIGAAAGIAIAAPLSIAIGLSSIFSSNYSPSVMGRVGRFALDVSVMFLSSFIISSSLYLGVLPAAAVAVGAAATGVAVEAVKGSINSIMG